MEFGLIRSIPLGRDTINAWRNAGGVFIPRGTSGSERYRITSRYPVTINLGNTNINPATIGSPYVLNLPGDIEALVTPGGARRLLDDFLPPRRTGTVWMKGPGRAGRNKFLVETRERLVLPSDWDWQIHVTGQEYRLITVGAKVVQDFKRYGENGSRVYEWVRMRDVPEQLKQMARLAARRVPGYNVIAWDMIATDDGRYFIFEGNTSPGMSTPTAQRIIREIDSYFGITDGEEVA